MHERIDKMDKARLHQTLCDRLYDTYVDKAHVTYQNRVTQIEAHYNELVHYVLNDPKEHDLIETALQKLAHDAIITYQYFSGDTTKASYLETCRYLNQVYRNKNHDYGDSFGITFHKLGLISALTRISDKVNRLVSLSTKEIQKVGDETLLDTLLDLANYAIMTEIELQKEG